MFLGEYKVINNEDNEELKIGEIVTLFGVENGKALVVKDGETLFKGKYIQFTNLEKV